jgi:hypothetical protein
LSLKKRQIITTSDIIVATNADIDEKDEIKHSGRISRGASACGFAYRRSEKGRRK